VNGVVPAAVTEKVAVWPTATVWLAGWVTIEGAAALIVVGGLDAPPQADSIRLTPRKAKICTRLCRRTKTLIDFMLPRFMSLISIMSSGARSEEGVGE
jgi:hypothetical protein